MPRLLGLFLLPLLLVACQVETPSPPGMSADSTATAGPSEPFIQATDTLAAGRYLVRIAGCNDCHTPGFLENGEAVPEAQWLTGLPIGFRGPWGTSYPHNLRLSVRQMDEATWVQTLRTRHALPPMPWPSVNAMSEQDVRALYRYIRSLGPPGPAAPEAVPPGQEPTTPYFDFVPQHMERLGTPPDSTATPADTMQTQT